MDPLSHSLVGGLAGKTLSVSPRRFWFMLFLGMIPDIDFVAHFFGEGSYLFHHHGLTHSLMGIFPLALLWSFLFKKWDAGPFWQRTWHYSLPIALHILGDILTNFGVQIFSPFGLRFYSWDMMGSFNLVPQLITVIALVWMHLKDRQGWRAAGGVWLMWILYLGLLFSGKAYAAKLANVSPGELTMIPTHANPFLWRGIHLDSEHKSYGLYSINILKGQSQLAGTVPMPNSSFSVEASRKSPDVISFLKNNRWPVTRVREVEMGWIVEWGEIMFSLKGMVRGKVRVEVDRNGTIVNERKIVSFWTPS